ncbi:rho-type GTPase activating protein Rga3 [Schizosaccharomyces cryophilus OY26]|uniref:Rho-type GTPase activating protein Rga3 n=1 Tax=Schizosaccharomyces cryophilus (strain OY26 / ATCC MYA-4695 / CBS 11777 / NBRC 106824 / NRRL Y48691) TaxID=653667 RepID=S9VQK1_SCHCR|nr:rho-type GTPase activating protein Rga3 [Schizosaccharomyces cryophilus OY26]EPY50233.1 rho-type GTPase activating protein Rga3 [Schizosaccharomyces cryophilus OY26]
MGFRKNLSLAKGGSCCTRCGRSFQRKETPISFGGRLWHNSCFTCAKCLNNLDQSNQLLIQTSDGRPVCSECSHTCTICQRPIEDYALMNGFDSYHRDCFQCLNCKKTINNSEFVKDGRSVYCSDCSSQNCSFMPPTENGTLRAIRSDLSTKHSEIASSHDSNQSFNLEVVSPSKSRSLTPEKGFSEGVPTVNNDSQYQVQQSISTNSHFHSPDSLFSTTKNESSTSFNSFSSPVKVDGQLDAPSPSVSLFQKPLITTNDKTLTAHNPPERKSSSPFKTISSSSRKPSEDYLNDFGFFPHQRQPFYTARLNRSHSNNNIRSLRESQSNSPHQSFLSPHDYPNVFRTLSPKSQAHRKSSSQPANIYGLSHFVSSPEAIPSDKDERRKFSEQHHSRSDSSQPTLVSPSDVPLEAKASTTNKNASSSSDIASLFENYKVDMEALKLQINKLTHLTESISSRSMGSGSESSLNLTENRDAIRTQKLEVCERFFSFGDVADDPILKDPLHQSLVGAADAYMKMLRDNYFQEITNLLERRNELLQDYSNAQKLLNESLEASVHLNAKNLELADLNNNLASQIQQRKELMESQSSQNRLFIDTKSLKPLSSDSAIDNQSSYQPSTSPLQASFNKLELRGLKLLNTGKANNRKSPFKSFHAKSKSADPVILDEKPVCHHVFQVNAIFKPSRCFICSETIWGSEVRCMKCSVACHSRCLKKVYSGNEELKLFSDEDVETNDNAPEMPIRVPPPEPSPFMFGRPLEIQAKIEKQAIPKVVQMCADCVDAHGLHIEGIYRISGSASQVRSFIEMFEQSNIQTETLASDITACTSVLKTYLHKLPTPLIPEEHYRKLLKAEEFDKGFAKKEMVKQVLQELPSEHLSVFQYLLQHLLRVAHNADKNLMTMKNLATVFAPTLMRETDIQLNLKNVNKRSEILKYVLENYEMIFTDYKTYNIPSNEQTSL